MAEKPGVKPFRTYAQQVDLLESRGMLVKDRSRAEQQLATLNYYRLSGYWHTMRRLDPRTGGSTDSFREGASFELVVELYEFDERLRGAIFTDLARIELAVRALIGHHLGAVDPLIYLDTDALGAPASQPSRRKPDVTTHGEWLQKFNSALRISKEEFVAHHRQRYDGALPVWVAVEVMDWGMLSYLYRMAPGKVRNAIAKVCGLTSPQMESWLKCLNILRNYAAHHARVFNRGFDITPKLSQDRRLDVIRNTKNRAFGQLTLIRYLHHELNLPGQGRLPAIVGTFPHNDLVPFERLGAPEEWHEHPLWKT